MELSDYIVNYAPNVFTIGTSTTPAYSVTTDAALNNSERTAIDSLSSNIVAAFAGANAPSGSNVFLTALDLKGNVNTGTLGTANIVTLSSDHPSQRWWLKSYSAMFTGVRDDILNISFNSWGTPDAARGSIGLQLENNYYDVSSGTTANEFIFSSNGPAGANPIRLLQLNEEYGTGLGTIFMRGTVYFYSSSPSAPAPFFTIDETGVLNFTLGSTTLAENNVQWMKQKNAAGVAKGLIYLDASSVTQIAPDGGGAKITGNSQLDGTLRLAKGGGFNALELSDVLANYKFGFYVSASTPNYLYMYTGSVYPMTWDSNGKVGINNYGPAYVLDVAGDTNVRSGFVYRVNGVQVIAARGAAVADATDAPSVITQLNALLARCRAHGLITT